MLAPLSLKDVLASAFTSEGFVEPEIRTTATGVEVDALAGVLTLAEAVRRTFGDPRDHQSRLFINPGTATAKQLTDAMSFVIGAARHTNIYFRPTADGRVVVTRVW